MVKINSRNSYSSITGLTPEQDKKLRNLLSYTIGSYHSGRGVRRCSLLSKRGEFPTGLLFRVMMHLFENDIDFHLDRPTAPALGPSYTLRPGAVPYKWQVEAADEAAKQQRGTIVAATGSGKSLAIALIIARLNVKTLVVVPSLEIKKQLTTGLLEALGSLDKVVVENIDSAALKGLTGFDCLIIDEAHHSAAATYRKLNKTAWAGIYYRFFFTATPFRNNDEEALLLESIAGTVIYELTYQESVAEGHIVPVEAFYLDLPKRPSDAYTWAEVYSELVVNNAHRNELIAYLLLSFASSGISALCLVKEVRHGERLSELTGLAFAHGSDPQSRSYIRQFNEGHISTLIATEGIMGEGVDSKPCEYVIIAGLGKAKSQLLQKCGRGVRRYAGKESAKVILFRDSSHKFTLRHYNAQAKIMKEYYGCQLTKLEIP